MKCKFFVLFISFLFMCNLNFAQNYVHDFETAKKMATEKKQPILMIFSGSDWCKPCIQLRSTILSSEEFIAFSDQNVVLLELDFPYKKKNKLPLEQQKHNDELAAKYNPNGRFPAMILLNEKGEILNEFHFNQEMTPNSLESAIKTSK